MTLPKTQNYAQEPVVLPVLAGTRGSRDNQVSVVGTLVAVVPQLAMHGPAADRMRAVAKKLDAEGTVDNGELDKILGDQEVMYVVVGKWPPPTTMRTDSLPLSEPTRELIDLLRRHDVMGLVVGVWPPEAKKNE